MLAPGKIRLLRSIQQEGSLRIAAKGLGISYQNIWDAIDDMNRRAPAPVVIKQRGGVGGGGARLSDYGTRLLNDYRLIEDEVRRFLRRLNTEINL